MSLGKPTNSNTPPAASASQAKDIWRFTNMSIIIIVVVVPSHLTSHPYKKKSAVPLRSVGGVLISLS